MVLLKTLTNGVNYLVKHGWLLELGDSEKSWTSSEAFPFRCPNTANNFLILSRISSHIQIMFCFSHQLWLYSIKGLKSWVFKLTFLALKMVVKSGLEFILKFTEPFQRYLPTCQANSALLGRFFCTGQQQLWRGSINFKINCHGF